MIYRIAPAYERDFGENWRFRAGRGGLEIARVLHGRMDVKRRIE